MPKLPKSYIAIAGIMVAALILGVGFAALTLRPVAAAGAARLFQSAGLSPAAAQTISPYWDVFVKSFAAHLGVDTSKLDSAFTAAMNDAIDQALKDGKITQAQADQLKSRVSGGLSSLNGFGPFGRGGFFGFGGRGFFRANIGLAEFAKALGISQQELMSQLQTGKSIADVAKAQNKDINQVKQTVLSDLKAQLDAAVSSGKLTQAQADSIYNRASSGIDALVNQTWPFHGRGFFWKNGPKPPVARPTPQVQSQ